MDQKLKEALTLLFDSWAAESVERIEKLPAHGSERQYYRIKGKEKQAIAAHNKDRAENTAFRKKY